jgi:GT2 family glycosyltransferase
MFEAMLNEKAASTMGFSKQVAVASESGASGQFFVQDSAGRVKEKLVERARQNASLIPATFFENQREPEVTIVMLSYGRSDMTLNAVRALRDNVRIPFKLLLIDNNSSDEVPKQLKEASSEYEFLDLILLQENLGCTRGRMDALQFVKTDYVMFLDNDVELLPGAVEHLLHAMKRNSEIHAATGMAVFPNGVIHVSGGDYWAEDGILYYDLAGAGQRFDDPAVPPSGRCRWINASMTMYQTSVLLEEPFDRSLDFTKRGYYEDLEWSYRLNKVGPHRFERIIESIGIHYHEPVVAGEAQRNERRENAMKYVEGIAYFYKKHGMIVQNLFDFIPEFRQTEQMTIQSVAIFLELVDSRGGEWVLDKWNSGQLAPLFMGPALVSELADKEQAIESLVRDLAEKDQALSSLGGRLLRLYGKIKYPYLLPVYRLLRLMPPEANVTPSKNRTE